MQPLNLMPISSPNSKKCSIADLATWTALSAAAVGAFLSLAQEAQSAPLPLTLGQSSSEKNAALGPSTLVLLKEIRNISKQQANSFDSLLRSWKARYGASALTPLLEIASAKSAILRALPDSERYIALMGAAKLGGPQNAPALLPFLKDSSWMIRSAALRALATLGNASTGRAVLPLLKDAALVVRLEAVSTVEKLRPHGVTEALLEAIEQKNNYHGGKAQWVPQKALSALAQIRAEGVTHRLRPLLDHEGDPELQRHAVSALDAITGKNLKPGSSLATRVREWKLTLARSSR